MALLSKREARPKHFPIPAFSRISEEQGRRLRKYREATGKTKAEAIRELMEIGMNTAEGRELSTSQLDPVMALELLQSVRTEVRTLLDAVIQNKQVNVMDVAVQAESVALADLQNYAKRRQSRQSLAQSLSKGATHGL